jgi:hypothetical protein
MRCLSLFWVLCGEEFSDFALVKAVAKPNNVVHNCAWFSEVY